MDENINFAKIRVWLPVLASFLLHRVRERSYALGLYPRSQIVFPALDAVSLVHP